MYSYEDRLRAVQLYIKLGKRIGFDHSAAGIPDFKVTWADAYAGPNGFEGGMSTKKYESITGTSRASASRELIELEALGLLARAGAGRSTRYYVKLPGWGPIGTA